MAHKILGDQEPKARDKTRSTVDPDARRSRHGAFFDGYLLDILVDADSSIITQINVFPGSFDESAKVFIPQSMACMATNVKCIVKLTSAPQAAQALEN